MKDKRIKSVNKDNKIGQKPSCFYIVLIKDITFKLYLLES